MRREFQAVVSRWAAWMDGWMDGWIAPHDGGGVRRCLRGVSNI